MSLAIHQRDLLYLLSSERECSLSELRDRLYLSTHSINFILESLRKYDDIFSITRLENNLKLNIQDNKEYERFMSERVLGDSNLGSFHKRQAFILQRLLMSMDYLTADNLIDELYVSRRTLTRDLRKIKQVTDKYSLDINSKAGVGIKITGCEFNKRLCFIYEVIDFFPEIEEIPKEILDEYWKIVSKHHLPFEAEWLFQKVIKLTILRKDFSIEKEALAAFIENIGLTEESPGLAQSFQDFLGRELSAEEAKFILFPLNIGLFPQLIENQNIEKETKEVLQIVEKEFGISFSLNEAAKLLNGHLVYLFNRSLMKYKFTDVSFREDILNNSFAFIISDFMVEKFKKNRNIFIDNTEVVLLSTWIEVLLSRKSRPLIRKIAVINQGGSSLNRLIEDQMVHFFNANVQIDFFDVVKHPTYKELEKIYDLVFTDNLMISDEIFQPFFSLSLITKENQHEREKLETKVLTRLLYSDCRIVSFKFDERKSYEENLLLLLHSLKKIKLVDEEFVSKLLEKEKRNFSISSNGLAFPHFVNRACKKTILVVSASTPLHLKSKNVADINDFVLICIPEALDDSNQDTLIKVFDRIFNLQESSTIAERLGVVNSEKGKIICLP